MNIKGILVIALVMIGFLVCPFKSMAEEKIGVVNLQQALNQVEEGKRAMEAIRLSIDDKKKKLESMKVELKTMRDDIEKQKNILSKEALQTKMGEIQNKFMELQQKAAQYDQELKQKETESVQKIILALRTKVVEIAKLENFDIVYENSTETILYSAKAVDLTDKLIKAYNRK